MEPAARTLVFHGTLVLLIGLLCGVPYGRAINAGAPAHRVSAWRLAHLSLPLGAILMFAVAPLLTPFAVAGSLKQLMAGLLIVSAYAFCVALPLAAITGERGLSARGPFPARIVFLANMGRGDLAARLPGAGLCRLPIAMTPVGHVCCCTGGHSHSRRRANPTRSPVLMLN